MKNIYKISTKEYLYIEGINPKKDFFSKLAVISSDICLKHEIVIENGDYCTSTYWNLIPLVLLLIPYNLMNFCYTAWWHGICEFRITSFKEMRTPHYSNYCYREETTGRISRYEKILRKKGKRILLDELKSFSK